MGNAHEITEQTDGSVKCSCGDVSQRFGTQALMQKWAVDHRRKTAVDSPRLIFINVNEDGVAYGSHETLDQATKALVEFPEDHVVVAPRTSFTARRLLEESDLMGTELSVQREAGAARVREWANPRVFTPEQVEVIHGWAAQLCADGSDAELSPKWPSRLRSTQQAREETARRLFREGAA